MKRGLHTGLNELLGDYKLDSLKANTKSEYRKLGVDQLQRGHYQPRQVFDREELKELADSIKAQGIIQPLIVRKIAGNRYEIIAGERRWRAAQLIGLTEVPVILKDVTDKAALAMSLIENIQREDLNAIEEAVAVHRLIEEFDLTHEQAAEAVGKSRTTVSNLLRLLNLNPEVRTFVEQNVLDMGQARALLALEGLQQTQAAEHIVAKGLTTRQAENLVRRLLQEKQVQTSYKSVSIDPDIRRLQNQLSDTLSAKVLIHHSAKGKGKLVIHYNSLDELDGILKHIG